MFLNNGAFPNAQPAYFLAGSYDAFGGEEVYTLSDKFVAKRILMFYTILSS